MTKRAWIVIAILVLVPIIVLLSVASRFSRDNRVVAEYGGDVDIIEYEGMTLHRVYGDFDYKFKFGEYLGKVGDKLTGAPLYRVADDPTESYFAIAEGGKKVLYTATGELVDGVRSNFSRVTRVIFDDYLVEETSPENVALIVGAEGKRVSVDMSEYPSSFVYYDLCLSFDSSAIVTEYFGRLIRLTEKDIWLYVSAEALAEAEAEYGTEITGTVYIADMISDEALLDLLNSYFNRNDSETNA